MPSPGEKTFGEELESIKTEVTRSLDRERNRESSPEEQGNEATQREMRAIREAMTTLTGHEPKTVVPPPVTSDGSEVDYFADVDEDTKTGVVDLVEETLSGGSITGAVAKAMKKNDPLFLDYYHDYLAIKLHQQLSDQNVL